MIPQRSNWNHRKYLPRTIKCINRLRFCCSQFILTCVFTCIFVFTIEHHIKTLRSHTNVAPCCFIMSTNNDATTQKNTIVMQCQPRIDYYLRFKFHIFSFTFLFQSAFKCTPCWCLLFEVRCMTEPVHRWVFRICIAAIPLIWKPWFMWSLRHSCGIVFMLYNMRWICVLSY